MLGPRLAAARRRAGLKQVELAAALGDRYDQAMISRVEAGHRTLRFDGLVEAARTLGVSLDYLAGLTDDPAPAGLLPPALLGEREADLVPLRDVRAAAGAGAEAESEPVIGHVAFPRRWLRRHRVAAGRCSVIEVIGDSMEPLLEDGCWILVDHERRALASGRVFVVRGADGLVVKRARRAGGAGGAWLLESENRAFEPLPLPRESRVVGEVRWAGRAL